jgi:PAS domain S-box-containing protein
VAASADFRVAGKTLGAHDETQPASAALQHDIHFIPEVFETPMNEAASFDAMLQCNLLEVFCEALGAAIFVTDKLDEISFASIRLLHLFPIRESAIAPGGRARDLYGALYDAGLRFGDGERPGIGGREDWIAERIASAWKERVDRIEQAGQDRWIRIVSRRFSSGLGFVVIQDVTEHKKKEILLRTEQERVKLTEDILDTLPVAVAVKDRNLNYVAVNQEFCRLIGTTQDAILGHGTWDALAPELAGRVEQMDWQLLSNGEPGLAHIIHTRPDGQTFELERRARRLGKPGSHYIAVSLTEEAKRQEDRGETIDRFEAALTPAAAAPIATRRPLRNVLFLTETPQHDHALKLALRAHDTDLCYIRDVPEFAAFLPAARAAAVAIDFVIIDRHFDPAAFNIAAAHRLNFRMLPDGASESRALAEILKALPQHERQTLEAPPIEPPALLTDGQADDAGDDALLGPAGLEVLAIEDNPVNRMVLEQMLGSLSVRFRIAGSGAEGLADFSEHAPLLVLADTTLPDMPIADLVLALRRVDPSAALIAIIPRESEELHRQAQAIGFDHSLSKPLSAEVLGSLVPDLLEERTRIHAGAGAPSRGILPT